LVPVVAQTDVVDDENETASPDVAEALRATGVTARL
jgi:hypothetical protein